ncbi:MAG: orotidine-5'-phosphate decarboxylase [Trueperaceae bacterium]|nr:orotidine-5'-phosphate decarboxylase [Trueperaceae bacterium]
MPPDDGDDPRTPFVEALHARMEALGTAVCMGIDPRPHAHPSTHPDRFGGDGAQVAKAVTAYHRAQLEAAADHLACVKFQAAFFERLGIPGWIGLAQLLVDARTLGLPAILDAKRGDVGSTADAYADAYLRDGPFVADALTVNPYLGMDALEPFAAAAEAEGRGLFALVRTSNPGGADLQDLALADGRSVADHVADLWTARAREGRLDVRGYGPFGAVVGGTHPDALARARARLPHAVLLVPGYGAQGADATDVAAAFDADGFGAVVSASRSLTHAGGDDPAASARTAAAAMQRAVRDAVAARGP